MKESIAWFCSMCMGIDLNIMVRRDGLIVFFCANCQEEVGSMGGEQGDSSIYDMLVEQKEGVEGV